MVWSSNSIQLTFDRKINCLYIPVHYNFWAITSADTLVAYLSDHIAVLRWCPDDQGRGCSIIIGQMQLRIWLSKEAVESVSLQNASQGGMHPRPRGCSLDLVVKKICCVSSVWSTAWSCWCIFKADMLSETLKACGLSTDPSTDCHHSIAAGGVTKLTSTNQWTILSANEQSCQLQATNISSLSFSFQKPDMNSDCHKSCSNSLPPHDLRNSGQLAQCT